MAAKHFGSLSSGARYYIGLVVLAGAATVLVSATDLVQGRLDSNWLWFGLLTLASGSATVRFASIPVAISISETFVFTAALLFGPSAGTLTVALDAAVISFWSYRKGQALYKIAFNICALPLTMWLSAHLFFILSGVGPLFQTDSPAIPLLLLPLIVFTVAYFTLSSWIVTLAIALEQRVPAFATWRDNFLWVSLNYFGGAFVALLLVSYSRRLDLTFFVIVVPLLAVLYATYAATVGRFEDANRHLTDLNTLYMATIETLAMAIDAKDQVTHGHIRRVQAYALGLARRLGVDDPKLIRAVEAAALLHDMGKLAVPEYILNKPGPLTAAEFDRMKLHSSVGADILSSIRFPYPVVPIVRHHHENWDGTGYPDGLKGTDIPIGARILSVVDCFDALTSDRPYRPRLSDSEATRILRERRGVMYDPLIVDTFLASYRELAPEHQDSDSSTGPGLGAIARVAVPVETSEASEGLEDIAASTEEMLILYELARGLAGHVQLSDAGDLISKHLRRIVPASACVFFLYEPERDILNVAYASGEQANEFGGLRVSRGERLTGWVAANKRSILNADPILDLGESGRGLRPRFRSCLSTPLIADTDLVGVLSVYSAKPKAFTEDHRRILEVIARQVAKVVKGAATLKAQSASPSEDPLSRVPASEQLEPFVASELEPRESPEQLSILLLHLRARAHLGLDQHGPVVSAVISAIRSVLRGADVLARCADNEFVVLLTQTDNTAAGMVAARLASVLVDSRTSTQLEFDLAVSTAPQDGTSLSSLISSARSGLQPLSKVYANSSRLIH